MSTNSQKKIPKKHLIILILRILETISDKDNPLTQVKIAEMISNIYPCDRKTVGRNIAFLKNVGYPIIKCSKGFYMSNQLFSREEIDFVVKCVRSSNEFKGNEEQRIDLCQRLNSSLSRYYKERN